MFPGTNMKISYGRLSWKGSIHLAQRNGFMSSAEQRRSALRRLVPSGYSHAAFCIPVAGYPDATSVSTNDIKKLLCKFSVMSQDPVTLKQLEGGAQGDLGCRQKWIRERYRVLRMLWGISLSPWPFVSLFLDPEPLPLTLGASSA